MSFGKKLKQMLWYSFEFASAAFQSNPASMQIYISMPFIFNELSVCMYKIYESEKSLLCIFNVDFGTWDP